jgi:hypothetical protein
VAHRLALIHAAMMGSDRTYVGPYSCFALPDISDNERIKVHTPKVRKHATKRRINKLHDNHYRKRGTNKEAQDEKGD